VGQVRETDFKCLGFQRRIKEPMDSGMFSFYQFIVKFMIVKILEFIVCYVNNIMFYMWYQSLSCNFHDFPLRNMFNIYIVNLLIKSISIVIYFLPMPM
jgi:hypothetical protein